MAEDQGEILQRLTTRFIELGNEMKNEGERPELVSAAMMSASGFYATYVAAGDGGALNASGVEKVTEAYQSALERVQAYKKQQMPKKAD